MRIHVIMKQATSPVTCHHDYRPHAAYLSKLAALAALEKLQVRATTNNYWIETVPLLDWPEKKGD